MLVYECKVIAQHVATWKEGDEKWAYHDDAAANIATHKVSLDPYRLESRKILALMKESLPSDRQKVEKAGIDEVFVDLSAQVHAILLERFTELNQPPPYGDPMEKLPLPSVAALDWKADNLVDLDDIETEMDDPDWDDVAMQIGSEIVRGVRAIIYDKLKYTCSAGIAKNKMLSKLGSGYNKPNKQTVIRNRAIQHFLSDFKFTKIRNLGGKLGDQVSQTFKTDTVAGLLPVPVEQLQAKFGQDTGAWVYNTIRGIDSSEVNARTQIKSMLSAKSFRPTISSLEQGIKWLRIFAADIFSRLVEEGVLENKRRPKTITLHHRHKGQTRSRQSLIPQGKQLDEEILFDLAKTLLNQIALEGNTWPCINLSLSVGGFEDGVKGNMGIGAFVVKGEDAQALKVSSRDAAISSVADRQPEKRLRPDSGGIRSFFMRKTSPEAHDSDSNFESHGTEAGNADASDSDSRPHDIDGYHPVQTRITDYICSRCSTELASAEELQSHQDWHFAKDLQDEERASAGNPSAGRTITSQKTQKKPSAPPKRSSRSHKPDPGQSKLKFG